MQSINLIRRLHEHRQWANRALVEAAAKLTGDQLRHEFAIGQGSIWQSLLHLYAAEFVWLEALLGNSEPLVPGDSPDKLPGNQQGEATIHSLSDLTTQWAKLDRRWNEFIAGLSDDDLDKPVAKKSTSSGKGKVFMTSASDVLLHVCTHAQYTTAQVVNMLRHAGAEDLPDTMLISLARRQAAESGD